MAGLLLWIYEAYEVQYMTGMEEQIQVGALGGRASTRRFNPYVRKVSKSERFIGFFIAAEIRICNCDIICTSMLGRLSSTKRDYEFEKEDVPEPQHTQISFILWAALDFLSTST